LKITDSPADDPIEAAGILNNNSRNSSICVLSKKHVRTYSMGGILVRSSNYTLNPNTDGRYTVLQATPTSPVYLVDSTGVGFDENSKVLPLANATLTASDGLVKVDVASSFYYGTAQPFMSDWQSIWIPLAPLTVALGNEYVTGDKALFTSAEYKNQLYQMTWTLIGALIAMSLIVPVARRYGASGKGLIPWLICGFMLSWLGVLMILSMRALPTLTTCPWCGKRRGVENDLCEHCGRSQSKPTDDGREIFEDAGLDEELLVSR
jgi:hypothetical protein